MDINIFEKLRIAHSNLEVLHKGLSQAIAYKEKYPKEQVLCDLLILKFVEEI